MLVNLDVVMGIVVFGLKRSDNSDTGKYVMRADRGRRRYIPRGSLVHVSAFNRQGNYASRLRPGVVEVQ